MKTILLSLLVISACAPQDASPSCSVDARMEAVGTTGPFVVVNARVGYYPPNTRITIDIVTADGYQVAERASLDQFADGITASFGDIGRLAGPLTITATDESTGDYCQTVVGL